MRKQSINDPAVGQDPRRLSPEELRELNRNSLKARRRRKRLTCWLLAIVFVLLAALPAYRLYQPYQAKSVYRTMRNLYGQMGSGGMNEDLNDEQLGALYDVNPDIGGWVIVPGTDINLPVVQTVALDSVYYVNHLFDGTENPYGTPYYLTDCTVGTPLTNTVVRGSEGLMGELSGYRTLAFYQKAPLLFLDTLDKAYSFKVLAVVEIEESEISLFSQSQFESAGHFHSFVTQMGQRSLLNTGITVSREDSLLTLLCDTDAGKLAVIGRAVREGEDFAVDTTLATLNITGDNQVTDWVVTATDWATGTDASTQE